MKGGKKGGWDEENGKMEWEGGGGECYIADMSDAGRVE